MITVDVAAEGYEPFSFQLDERDERVFRFFNTDKERFNFIVALVAETMEEPVTATRMAIEVRETCDECHDTQAGVEAKIESVGWVHEPVEPVEPESVEAVEPVASDEALLDYPTVTAAEALMKMGANLDAATRVLGMGDRGYPAEQHARVNMYVAISDRWRSIFQYLKESL